MKSKFLFSTVVLSAVMLLSGCGGSGGTSNATPKAKGSAHIVIKWPQKVAHALLVPNAAGAIKLVWVDSASKTNFVVVTAPTPAGTATSNIVLQELQPGAATITANAFPTGTASTLNTDGTYQQGTGSVTGTTQATNSVSVNIVLGSQVSFTIDMASTVNQAVWTPPTGTATTTAINGSGALSGPINAGTTVSFDVTFSNSTSPSNPVVIGKGNVSAVGSGGVTVLGTTPVDDGSSADTRVRVTAVANASGTIVATYVDNDNLARVFTLKVPVTTLGLTTQSPFFAPAKTDVINDIDVASATYSFANHTSAKTGNVTFLAYSTAQSTISDAVRCLDPSTLTKSEQTLFYTKGTALLSSATGTGRLSGVFGSFVGANTVWDLSAGATAKNLNAGLTSLADLTSDTTKAPNYYVADNNGGFVVKSTDAFSGKVLGSPSISWSTDNSYLTSSAAKLPAKDWSNFHALEGITSTGTTSRLIANPTSTPIFPPTPDPSLSTTAFHPGGTVVAISGDRSSAPSVGQGLTYALVNSAGTYSVHILSWNGQEVGTPLTLTGGRTYNRIKAYSDSAGGLKVYVSYSVTIGVVTTYAIDVLTP